MNNNHASLTVTLQWTDGCAKHTASQYFAKANLWRDILPIAMNDAFANPIEGMEVQCDITPGEAYEAFDQSLIKTIKRNQFNVEPRPGLSITPKLGRYYPRNFVRNEIAITSEDRRPMRVIILNDETMQIDLNSPMASYKIAASVKIEKLLPSTQEHGGRCNDFIYDMLQTGIGMQSCMTAEPGNWVDFFSGEPFRRLDERDDGIFYAAPRLVHHLDETARIHIDKLYQQHLSNGMSVLDLMSSWVSHISNHEGLDITGLGMNEQELEKNKTLSDYVVHNLNTEPKLPFGDELFDRVLCTASIEYLINPIEVLRDVARCLKPGGQCIVTFSDRWFPPKAIQIWSELHPYERVGLVIDYFRQADCFSEIETLSIQHYPRPEEDKYSEQMPYSDPVFAVWAMKNK